MDLMQLVNGKMRPYNVAFSPLNSVTISGKLLKLARKGKVNVAINFSLAE